MQTYILIAVAIIGMVLAQHGESEYHHEDHYVDYHDEPKYHFDYSVNDPKHMDSKSQWEKRDGEHVKGEYSVFQPDHKLRTVKYQADKHGFQAEVHYEGFGHEHHQILGGEHHQHNGGYEAGH